MKKHYKIILIFIVLFVFSCFYFSFNGFCQTASQYEKLEREIEKEKELRERLEKEPEKAKIIFSSRIQTNRNKLTSY